MPLLAPAKPKIEGLVLDVDLSLMLPTVNRGRIGDQSIKGNHGVVYGRPAGAFVAATDDYALIESSVLSQFPFTVAGWFNTSTAATQVMFWCGDKDSDVDYLDFSVYTDGEIEIVISGWAAYTTGLSLDDGVNHHFAVTVYIDTIVKADVYIDGDFKETVDSGANWPTTFWNIAEDRTAIGRAMDSTPLEPFDGTLWKWHAYDNKQADADDVRRLYDGYALTSPSAIWEFSEATGATIADTSGNGDDLTATGMGWDLGANGGDLDVTAAGRELKHENTAYIEVADHSTLRFGTGDFQCHVWAKCSSSYPAVHLVLFGKGTSGAGEWYFRITNTGNLRLYGDGGISTESSGTDYRDDTMHLFSMIRHGSDVDTLVDGVSVDTDASGGADLSTADNLRIGNGDSAGQGFGGIIKRTIIATGTKTIAQATLDALAIFKRGPNA